jgi:hypothetical protein
MNAALFSAISRLILGAALACGGSAMATDNAAAVDAQARYRHARAACMKGQSDQNRVACLRKAEAAVSAARRERLDDGAPPCARQSRQRCEGLPEVNRRACVECMRGQGTRGGNAASGGLYRGLVLRERVSPSTAAPTTGGPVEPAKCPASWPPSRNTPGHDPSETSRDGTCA